MVRTSQGGSVLSFVVIGFILIGLLIGGAYFISRQSAGDTLPQPPTSAPEQQKPSPSDESSTSADKDDPGSKTPAPQPASSPATSQELPATGTKEVLGTLFMLAIFSGTVVSYVRSRRPSFSL